MILNIIAISEFSFIQIKSQYYWFNFEMIKQ